MTHQFDFFTQYNQFYICDSDQSGDVPSDFWSEEAYDDRLGIAKGMIGIGTQSYGHIRGEVVLLQSPTEVENSDRYDHIVEGGLNVQSGVLQFLTCPTSSIALKLNIKPGTYRVRVYTSGIKGTDIDEDEGSDYYKIEIWPDSNLERKVIKIYGK